MQVIACFSRTAVASGKPSWSRARRDRKRTLLFVDNDFMSNFVAVIQTIESRPLDGADMRENIRAARVGLNEPEVPG